MSSQDCVIKGLSWKISTHTYAYIVRAIYTPTIQREMNHIIMYYVFCDMSSCLKVLIAENMIDVILCKETSSSYYHYYCCKI